LDISDDNRLKFNLISSEYKREIIIVDAKEIDDELNSGPINSYFGNKATFYHVFFERFFPNNVKRILYIDSDTIITGKLDEINEFQFSAGKACAMIRERVFEGYNSLIGLNESDDYFNAGIILYDTDNWKELNCNERLMEGINNGNANYYLADQDLLCLTINENIQVLPFKYNVHSLWLSIGIKNLYYFFDVDERNLYSLNEIYDALKNPVILHCSRSISGAPWEKGNKNPFKDEWVIYKNISPWKNLKETKIKRSFRGGIMWLIFNFMPRYFYVRIFKAVNKKSIIKRLQINNNKK